MVTLAQRGVFTPFETLVESLGSSEGRRLEARKIQLEADRMKAAEREAAANRNAQIHQQAVAAMEARRSREAQERLVRQQMAQQQAKTNRAGTVQYGRGLTGGASTMGPGGSVQGGTLDPNAQIQSNLSQRALEMIQRGDLEGLRGFKFKPEGVEYTPFEETPAKLPTSIQEAQYISEITGEPLDQVVRATSGLNQKVRPGEIPEFPGVKLETGMTYLIDPATGKVLKDETGLPVTQALPGSKRAAEFEKAKKQAEDRQSYSEFTLAPQIDAIGVALAKIREGALDIPILPEGQISNVTRGLLSGLPGTGAESVQNAIGTVASIISLEALKQMRLNSPTGGALGNVSDKEGQRLEAAKGDLSVARSPKEVEFNLMRVQNLVIDMVYGTEAVRAKLPKPIQEEINRRIEAEGHTKFDLASEAKKLLTPKQAEVFQKKEKREINEINKDYFDDSGRLRQSSQRPTGAGAGAGTGARSGSVTAGGNLPRLGPPLRPYYG
jgi:hypothetical protein